LIAFGFSVYKFFQIEAALAGSRHDRLIGPKDFGFIMILIGLGSLLMATVQHRLESKALRAEYPRGRWSLPEAVAALAFLLGVFALIAVLFGQ